MLDGRIVRLPYGGAGMELVVPERNLAAVLEPRPVSPAANPLADVEAALDAP